jgi:hypothetical protein
MLPPPGVTGIIARDWPWVAMTPASGRDALQRTVARVGGDAAALVTVHGGDSGPSGGSSLDRSMSSVSCK